MIRRIWKAQEETGNNYYGDRIEIFMNYESAWRNMLEVPARRYKDTDGNYTDLSDNEVVMEWLIFDPAFFFLTL
jgi:hypothetical protein